MDSVLFALWFFLPAGGANMAPIIAAHTPGLSKWNAPVDAGKKFRGKPVLGSHKTWRGFASGIVAAIAVVYIQQLLWQSGSASFLDSSSTNYLHYSPVLLGFLFGFGALAGDSIESFFKRQFGIEAGKRWFPFDQIDYIVGGCVAMALLARLELHEYALVLGLWFMLHIAFSYVGYLLKLKARPI